MTVYIITVYFRTLDTVDLYIVHAKDSFDLSAQIKPTLDLMCKYHHSLDVEIISIVQGGKTIEKDK